MLIQITISDVFFNEPAHYFIKISLDLPESPSSRTEVSTLGMAPNFRNHQFQFKIEPSKTLFKSSVPPVSWTADACIIEKNPGKNTVKCVGRAQGSLLPNKNLSKGQTDMQIIYFKSLQSPESVGKAIMTFSDISNNGVFQEQQPRLDPLQSFQELMKKTEIHSENPTKDATGSTDSLVKAPAPLRPKTSSSTKTSSAPANTTAETSKIPTSDKNQQEFHANPPKIDTSRPKSSLTNKTPPPATPLEDTLKGIDKSIHHYIKGINSRKIIIIGGQKLQSPQTELAEQLTPLDDALKNLDKSIRNYIQGILQ